jgi:quinol monooxygenase YgiN
MVTVIATIRAKSGKEKETELLLRGLLEPTHAESGCVKYTLNQRNDQPGTFYFVEAWKTIEALQAHLSSSHLTRAMARKDELLESVDIAQTAPVMEGSSPKGTLWNL